MRFNRKLTITDGNPILQPSPYTVAWNTQPPDGTYTIAVQATDNVGNTATDGTSTVTVDNSAP